MSLNENDPSCTRCQALEEQLFRLTMERDLLSERLAAEKERANALFLSYPPQAHDRPPPPPPLPPVEPKPFRYQLADALNDLAFKLPGYWLARRAAMALTAPATSSNG
jgi:hypothetical protein